jgi:hypothetical protein
MKKFLSALIFFIVGSIATLITGFAFAQTIIHFPDVKSTDWFYNDVNNMVDWGVIKGNADGTFRPESNVNRAELSAILNRYNDYLKTQFVEKDTVSSNDAVSTTESDSSYVSDSKTIDINTKGTLNGVSLTVKSVKAYTGNNITTAATSGSKFVSADILVENNTGKPIDVSPDNFALMDESSGIHIKSDKATQSPEFVSRSLENGKSMQGYLVFEVPKSTKLTQFMFADYSENFGTFYVTLD